MGKHWTEAVIECDVMVTQVIKELSLFRLARNNMHQNDAGLAQFQHDESYAVYQGNSKSWMFWFYFGKLVNCVTKRFLTQLIKAMVQNILASFLCCWCWILCTKFKDIVWFWTLYFENIFVSFSDSLLFNTELY